LLAEARRGHKPPVLVIDEAQNLSGAVLEEIRLLTNLETSEGKLIQVILVGQPELEEKLAKPSLRQLRQRIAVRAHIAPLPRAETVEYIQHRLSVAGCTKPSIFSHQAFTGVWVASGGLPRLVNLICEHALVTAYGAGRKHVFARDVAEVSEDLGIKIDPEAVSPAPRAKIGGAPVVRMRIPGRPTAVAGAIVVWALGYLIFTLLSSAG
jgi:general secretion pathway protein A